MEKELVIRNEMWLNASPEKVWEALTHPDQTEKYMFNCRVQTDWKVSSKVDWAYNGTTYVTGNVVSIDAPRRLVYTVFDPQGDYKDVPENYLTVAYELIPQNGGTLLKVEQGDYAKVEQGERRYADAPQGWEPVLVEIKKVVEG